MSVQVTQKRYVPRKSTKAPGWDVISTETGAILRYNLVEAQALDECRFLNANEKIVMSWDEPKMLPVTEKKRIVVPGGF